MGSRESAIVAVCLFACFFVLELVIIFASIYQESIFDHGEGSAIRKVGVETVC